MSEPTITCPSCRTEFALTQSLAGPLLEANRQEFQARLDAKDDLVAERERALALEKAGLEATRLSIDVEIARRLDAERMKIVAEEAQKARRVVALDLEATKQQLDESNRLLAEREAKLGEAQAAQAEVLRIRRELEDQKREISLTVERQVQVSLTGEREKAKREAEDGMALKVRERDEIIAGMQRQIEMLKQRAEQGSVQLQGEVMELLLEDLVRERFPRDEIAPVPKGVRGGDCLQRVIGADGQPVGSILWEVKRTKAWSDQWLPKLRGDQRDARADIAIIVSHSLPKDIDRFGQIDGVWIAEPECALQIATALREHLIAVAGARRTGEGQVTKAAQLYEYMTGPRFRHHVTAIVDHAAQMRADLDRERRSLTRIWAKRETQISSVVMASAAMYGDLQGIAGRTFEGIDWLELDLLPSPADDPEDEE